MMMFLWTALSGWLATLLLGAGVSLPYVIRSARQIAIPYLVRLRPHYWLGFTIPIVGFVHAWLPMSAGHIRGFNRTGLLLATAALVAMLWQIGLGLSLRNAEVPTRRKIRPLHFWTMVVTVGLVATHIVLNRA
jgi:hypothetical protein